MNTIIEYTDSLGLNYYYTNVEIACGNLTFDTPKGIIKTFHKQLDIAQITDFTLNSSKNGGYLAFYYGDDFYTLIDYGNGILFYLQQQLIQQLIKNEQKSHVSLATESNITEEFLVHE